MKESSTSRARAFLAAFLLAIAVYAALRLGGASAFATSAKPLPVLVLAAWLLATGGRRETRVVAAGLVLSGLGDVLLDLPGRFILGMAAFAAAHVCYVASFVLDETRRPLALPWLVPFAAYAVCLVGMTLPSLGPLAAPVVAYGALLTTMMWRAAARVRSEDARTSGPMLVAAGALVFGLSDSLILLRLSGVFGDGIGPAVLATYWSGQLGIAYGTLRR